ILGRRPFFVKRALGRHPYTNIFDAIAIAEVFSLLLNQFLRDWCRISHRCDGTILFSSTASRSITDVEPYTPSARAIR
ncbi:hypothetical protein, partial [Collinsella aerofaciens]|uniref:hypothetical protein n=1 Tax=Collinsella aerofaciens TaxID=74426 RepID=UPI0035626C07